MPLPSHRKAGKVALMRLMTSLALAAVLAAPAFAPTALAKPADGPSTRFQPMDLFGLAYAADPEIRPDGGAVAYVRMTYDVMSDRAHPSIWVVDTATGAQTPLASGPGWSERSPRWSPDGKRLAYVAAAEGEKPQLYVRWMETGQVAKVATLADAPRSIAWSPDGKTLAFSAFVPDDAPTMGSPGLRKPEGAKWAEPIKVITAVTYRRDDEGYTRPGFTHLFIVPADGGAPHQLTFGAFDDSGGLSWTADGKALLFSTNRRPDWERATQQSEVFRVDIADGKLGQLTHRIGPNRGAQMSPDGKLVAYTGYDDRHRGYENALLYVMNADGSNPHALTTRLDRSVSSPRWAADGKAIFLQYDDHGMTKVVRVSLDGQWIPVAQGFSGSEIDRPYTGGEFTVSKTGIVAFTQGSPDEPGDVAIAQVGGAPRRLTSLNASLLQGKTLAHVAQITVPSSVDGLPIDAWIMTPPDYQPGRRYPMILEIHGGPYSAYGPAFGSELQLFASAGYVVVYANPRGSTSYGFDFADTINDNYPSHDYDDLMSVVDAVIAKGVADPNNLFVTGGSGGGLLTAWIVGKTDRFKAAVTQKPVINWTSEVLTTDMYVFMAQDWFSKPPWEDPETYWRRSPLSLVGNVKTPTMVMVGEEDHRTPDNEAEEFFQALQIRAVPTALVRVPGASHHALAERPSQQAEEAAAIIAWFGKYRTGP